MDIRIFNIYRYYIGYNDFFRLKFENKKKDLTDTSSIMISWVLYLGFIMIIKWR